jgi:hypothetical protein
MFDWIGHIADILQIVWSVTAIVTAVTVHHRKGVRRPTRHRRKAPEPPDRIRPDDATGQPNSPTEPIAKYRT